MTSSPGRRDGRARGPRDGRARGPRDGTARGPRDGTAPARRSARPLILVAAALLGVVVCVLGLVVYRHVDAHVPWGLVLALAAALLTTRAAGYLAGTVGAVAFAVPYAVVLLLTMSSRPEGDYLVAADALGYTFLLGALVALGVGVALTARDPGHTAGARADVPRTLDA